MNSARAPSEIRSEIRRKRDIGDDRVRPMSKQPSYDEFAEAVWASFSDEDIVRFWTDGDLLAQLRQKNKGRQKQVIHDIPRRPQDDVSPYDLAHRVLKDIYFKAAALMATLEERPDSTSKKDSSDVDEAIAVEAAQMAKEGEEGECSERACCWVRDARASGFEMAGQQTRAT